jgi:hypothetical protein
MTHAFPHNTVVVDKEGGIVEHHKGMTMRDYFAAKAMQGMLAESGGGALHNTNLSEFAYLIADAMLKAREA